MVVVLPWKMQSRHNSLLLISYHIIWLLFLCLLPASSNAGYELKVAIASDSLDISCEACDEGYYKPDDGAQ